jgi:hypothetical protein
MIEFKSGWETFGIQVLWKTIAQCVTPLVYPKMHLVSRISESIQRIGTGDIATNDISEQLHIPVVKEPYQSSNDVNFIRQMLKHNARCTGLDYMEETLSYLALQGW